jgi:hypothetical protein
MHLIEDRIKNIYPLKKKKVGKQKLNSIRDIFKYFCAPKIELGYKVKKEVLLRPLEEVKLKLEAELKQKRSRYVILRALYADNQYDPKLEEDTQSCSASIKKLSSELQDIEYENCSDREIISYTDFKQIILIHNKFISEAIIENKPYLISYQVGTIEARLVERNHKNIKVNFGATNKKKRELLASGVKEEDLYNKVSNPTGIKYIHYHIDDDYGRISWDKGKLRNIRYYMFKPSVSNSLKNGFKNRFSQAMKERPELKRKYPKVNYTKDDI